jgi:hypothetical protein
MPTMADSEDNRSLGVVTYVYCGLSIPLVISEENV